MANTEQALNKKMRQALEAVQAVASKSDGIAGWHKNGEIAGWDEILPEVSEALDAIPAASAEAAQPVAWYMDKPGMTRFITEREDAMRARVAGGWNATPLYTAPQASQPIGQPVSDDMVMKYCDAWSASFSAANPFEEVLPMSYELLGHIRKGLEAVLSASNSQPVSGAELTDKDLLEKAHKHGMPVYPNSSHPWMWGANLIAFARDLLSASGQASQSEKAVRDAALHEAAMFVEYCDRRKTLGQIADAIRALASTPAQQTDAPVNVPELNVVREAMMAAYFGTGDWSKKLNAAISLVDVMLTVAAPAPVEQTEAQQSGKDGAA
jgi:hypothetical protein